MTDGTTRDRGPERPGDLDGRPRPRYGEYAPPGWVSPVEPVAVAEPVPTAGGTGRPASVAASSTTRPGSRADRIVTMVLFGLGAYNVVVAVLGASTFAVSLLALLRDRGFPVDDFTAQDALQRVGVLSAVLAVALFVLAVVVARRRLRAGRLAFWVPLVAGVVFTLVQAVAVAAVVMGDASFLEALRSMPAPPGPFS